MEKSELRKGVELLLKSTITGYRISKETGVSQQQISVYRKNEAKIDNMTLKHAELLYKFAKENKII